jgi:hypothetical protein
MCLWAMMSTMNDYALDHDLTSLGHDDDGGDGDGGDNDFDGLHD